MARPRRIDWSMIESARQMVQRAQNAEEFRQAMAVLLPAELGATLEQMAKVLGVGRATVARLQARFRQRVGPGGQVRRAWGGRRRALMSKAQEEEFLRPWVEQAQAGGVLVVSPIRAALAQRLGQPVAHSVVYRLLARHGWRKVAPDTRHPKSDPQVQEAWKKNFHKKWQIV